MNNLKSMCEGKVVYTVDNPAIINLLSQLKGKCFENIEALVESLKLSFTRDQQHQLPRGYFRISGRQLIIATDNPRDWMETDGRGRKLAEMAWVVDGPYWIKTTTKEKEALRKDFMENYERINRAVLKSMAINMMPVLISYIHPEGNNPYLAKNLRLCNYKAIGKPVDFSKDLFIHKDDMLLLKARLWFLRTLDEMRSLSGAKNYGITMLKQKRKTIQRKDILDVVKEYLNSVWGYAISDDEIEEGFHYFLNLEREYYLKK